jgi:hypothetical protein
MMKLRGSDMNLGKPRYISKEGRTITRINGIKIRKNTPAGIYAIIFCFVLYSLDEWSMLIVLSTITSIEA